MVALGNRKWIAVSICVLLAGLCYRIFHHEDVVVGVVDQQNLAADPVSSSAVVNGSKEVVNVAAAITSSEVPDPKRDKLKLRQALFRQMWSTLIAGASRDVPMTIEEQERFVDVALKYRSALTEIERAHTTSEIGSDGTSLDLTIAPYYDDDASSISNRFYGELIEMFGADRYAEVDRLVGDELDAWFQYWGLYRQKYVVSRLPDDEQGVQFQINHMVLGDPDLQLPGIGKYHTRFGGSNSLARAPLDSFVVGDLSGIEPFVRAYFGIRN